MDKDRYTYTYPDDEPHWHDDDEEPRSPADHNYRAGAVAGFLAGLLVAAIIGAVLLYSARALPKDMSRITVVERMS